MPEHTSDFTAPIKRNDLIGVELRDADTIKCYYHILPEGNGVLRIPVSELPTATRDWLLAQAKAAEEARASS